MVKCPYRYESWSLPLRRLALPSEAVPLDAEERDALICSPCPHDSCQRVLANMAARQMPIFRRWGAVFARLAGVTARDSDLWRAGSGGFATQAAMHHVLATSLRVRRAVEADVRCGVQTYLCLSEWRSWDDTQAVDVRVWMDNGRAVFCSHRAGLRDTAEAALLKDACWAAMSMVEGVVAPQLATRSDPRLGRCYADVLCDYTVPTPDGWNESFPCRPWLLDLGDWDAGLIDSLYKGVAPFQRLCLFRPAGADVQSEELA